MTSSKCTVIRVISLHSVMLMHRLISPTVICRSQSGNFCSSQPVTLVRNKFWFISYLNLQMFHCILVGALHVSNECLFCHLNVKMLTCNALRIPISSGNVIKYMNTFPFVQNQLCPELTGAGNRGPGIG